MMDEINFEEDQNYYFEEDDILERFYINDVPKDVDYICGEMVGFILEDND